MKKRAVFLIGFLLASMAVPVAYASDPFDKLGRGVANMATGWLELPTQVMQTTESQGSLAGMSVGFARGVAFGVGRTVLGVFETVTFLLPNHVGEKGPDPDAYGPIVEPEYLVFRRGDKP